MIQALQDRIQAQLPQLRLVSGTAGFAALEEAPPREKLPAAYVIPLDDSAAPSGMATQVTRQRLERRISVLLMASSARDPRGEAAAEALEPLVAALRAALVGWTPALGTQPSTGARLVSIEPLNLVRGGLLSMADGVMVWEDTYVAPATLSTLA